MKIKLSGILTIYFCAFGYQSVLGSNPNLDEAWHLFTHKFEKNPNDTVRRSIFESNLNLILAHNIKADLGLRSYRLGVNQFADLTNKEFRNMMNGFRRAVRPKTLPENYNFIDDSSEDVLPKNVDWRKKGYVTKVKNQGQCGSCWAFSATGAVEGAHFRATKKLVSLSEQNLVDCSTDEGNNGCSGGLMDYAFKYIIKKKGIDTEASYPYSGEDGECEFKRQSVGATIKKIVDVSSGSENALQKAVATVGPVSVAIDASQSSFQFYQSGVYDEPDCSSDEFELDHGVLAVGYGVTDEEQNYWIVKNSWGISWGNHGYILMSRNKDNQCGIATLASYPVA